MKSWTLALATLAFGFCSDGRPFEPMPGTEPSPTPIGAPTGEPASTATIGPEGGTFTSADGRIVLTVPAGAVTQATTISVQPIQNHAHGGVGVAYRLSPHGVTFAQPVRLSFRYTEADVAGTVPQLLRLAYQDEQRRWRMFRQPEIDAGARTVSVQTTHFSDWSLVPGANLLPASATVRVGNMLELRVKDCLPARDSGELVAPLAYECRDGIYAMTAGDWFVNGRRGGSSAAGTITPDSRVLGVATYRAPAAVPSANPVAVSVEYTGLAPLDRGRLVSNITVTDPATACAGLRNVEEWNGTLGLSYSFAVDKAETVFLSIDHFAEVTAHLRKLSEGPGGVSWIGPLAGTVRVNDRHLVVRPPPAGDTETTVVGGGPPLNKQPLENGAFASLSVNLTNCTYNLTMTVGLRATQTHSIGSGAPDAVVMENLLGSVRSAPRPIGGGTNLSGGKDFEARSVLAAGQHEGDMYVPGWLGSLIFFNQFVAMDGVAGTARVQWSFQPQAR